MEGYGGAPVIWQNVKNTISKYIDCIDLNEKLIIYSFDEDLYGPEIYNLTNEAKRKEAKGFIDRINADGNYTCINKALEKVFSQLKIDSSTINLVYLYTDGLNTTSHCSGEFREAIRKFNLNRGKFDHCFYISLGLPVPNEVVEAADDSNNNLKILESPAGKVQIPTIISPRALSLNYDPDHMSLNQAYKIYGDRESIKENFNIEISKVNIKGLTGTQNDPELTPLSHSPLKTTSLRISFLNVVDKNGEFSGTIEYKERPVQAENIYVIPNKIKILYSNIANPAITIAYPESHKNLKLNSGDTITRMVKLRINKDAANLESDILFKVSAPKDNLTIRPAIGKLSDNVWVIPVGKLNINTDNVIKFSVFQKSPRDQQFTDISIEVSDEIKNQYGSNIQYLTGNVWKIGKLTFYQPAPFYVKIIKVLFLIIVVGLLSWFIYFRRHFFPKMKGIVMVASENVSIRLTKYARFYFYSGVKPKQNVLCDLFIGEAGYFSLNLSKDILSNGYIIIKPETHGNKQRNKLLENGDIFIASGNKTLIHDEEYEIKNKISNDSITFQYDNPKDSVY